MPGFIVEAERVVEVELDFSFGFLGCQDDRAELVAEEVLGAVVGEVVERGATHGFALPPLMNYEFVCGGVHVSGVPEQNRAVGGGAHEFVAPFT